MVCLALLSKAKAAAKRTLNQGPALRRGVFLCLKIEKKSPRFVFEKLFFIFEF
jgi:hypothetical protein